MTIAEQWLKKIDAPIENGYESIDRQAVEDMQGDAQFVDEVNGTHVYVFRDFSGLYEKHNDDWHPAETAAIAQAIADNC